ncbi:MAG: hypothetical protein IPN34_11930 [Planctomycetes bacterium]|nr:hypothetical protein [Planctomycetota bacterium]
MSAWPRFALVASLLALAALLAPARALRRERALERLSAAQRARRAVLAPFAPWFASAHWLAAGAAMEREDPEAAYEHGLELLLWLPGDDARAAELVLYFGVAAVLPLLQESPPRVELAFTLVRRAVDLGDIALERGASREVLEVLRLVLSELELDYRGDFGLRARWTSVFGETPASTAARFAAAHPLPHEARPDQDGGAASR